MLLVHRHAAETPLPEMAGPLATRMNDARIAAVHRRQRPSQPIRIGRHEDQVDMVRHQAPRSDVHAGGAAGRREQVAIERVVVIAEESSRPAVATLGDVVRMTWNNDTGEASHAPGCAADNEMSIKCTVTVIYELMFSS